MDQVISMNRSDRSRDPRPFASAQFERADSLTPGDPKASRIVTTPHSLTFHIQVHTLIAYEFCVNHIEVATLTIDPVILDYKKKLNPYKGV